MANIDALHEIQTMCEKRLQPALKKEIWDEMRTLLNRYPDPFKGFNEKQINDFMDDWCSDLANFPLWAIEEACASWRKSPEMCKFPPRGMGDLKPFLDRAVCRYVHIRNNAATAIKKLEKKAINHGN